MKILRKKFKNREELISYLKTIAPWSNGSVSDIIGGRYHAETTLCKIDPINYGNTRNYGNGKVTKLSPYIHHGLISLNQVRNYVLEKISDKTTSYKFIQELGWRDFWQLIIKENPNYAWTDIENYKTGFSSEDYFDKIPDDILKAKTNNACINHFINELLSNGYIHNHARMYLASYVVHFRQVKWQIGAKWFLEHLLDGDIASNNLSWQWIASTFSNKPYIFNLENIDKYFGSYVDTSSSNNQELDFSYEEISKKLFPKLKE